MAVDPAASALAANERMPVGFEDPAQFCCPITQQLIEDPVRVIGEHPSQIFERAALEDWITRNDGNYIGPQTRKKIFRPKLKSCEEMKKQISAYKECKKRMKEEMDKVADTEDEKPRKKLDPDELDRLSQQIVKLEQLGAVELAESFRQRLYWLREFAATDEGQNWFWSVGSGAASAGIAATTASGAPVIAAVGSGVTAASLTRNKLRERLEQIRREKIRGINQYTDRLIGKLDSGEDSPESIALNHELVDQTSDEIEMVLAKHEELMIDFFAVIVGITAGLLVGGTIGVAVSGVASSVVAAGEAATYAGPALVALAAANPAVCAAIGAGIIGFGVWYAGRRYGWWKKSKPMDKSAKETKKEK